MVTAATAALLALPQGIHSFSTTTPFASRNILYRQQQQQQQQPPQPQQQLRKTLQPKLLWATKGFDKTSSSSVGSGSVESKDDKKRKKTIDGFERWAKSVGIL